MGPDLRLVVDVFLFAIVLGGIQVVALEPCVPG
jgi:hypothetical protein